MCIRDSISVEELVKLIPKSAFTPIPVEEQTYYTFTFTVRIPSIGKVRLVISFNTPEPVSYTHLDVYKRQIHVWFLSVLLRMEQTVTRQL